MASSDDGIFVLGNYKLIDVLGIGAMGYVYRARQLNLDRDVAVKILSPKLAQETGYSDLFIREARMAASLEHPHIVPIFDYGVQYEVSYVAMRLLMGGSLDERLQYRQNHDLLLPSLFEIVSILTQAAAALDYAHARGVIHRDIKPTNLMFDQHGTVYIVDFGIAKLVGTTTANKGGTFLGTPSFMAPEQWQGLAPTPAVDQYALGAVIYMMITGHPPFESDNALALMTKHMSETPKEVQFYRPQISPQINAVLQTAMAKHPEDRFPTVMAFAQAFAAAIPASAGEGPTEFTTYVLPQPSFSFPFLTATKPPSVVSAPQATIELPQPAPISSHRGRNLILWIETGLLLLALGLIVLLVSQRPDPAPPVPTSVAPLVVAQEGSATPTDDSILISTHQENVALQPALTDTQTFTTIIAVSPASTSTDMATFTPTVTPTATATNISARPTVHWDAGTPLRISNPNGAWLRARASTGARQVATLAYNNPVTSTGNYFFDGRQWWWQVKASWGAVGWVEQYSLIQN